MSNYKIEIRDSYYLDYFEDDKVMRLDLGIREPVIYLNVWIVAGWLPPKDDIEISIEDKERITINIYNYLLKKWDENHVVLEMDLIQDCDCVNQEGVETSSLVKYQEWTDCLQEWVWDKTLIPINRSTYKCEHCGAVWEKKMPDFPEKGYVKKTINRREKLLRAIAKLYIYLKINDKTAESDRIRQIKYVLLDDRIVDKEPYLKELSQLCKVKWLGDLRIKEFENPNDWWDFLNEISLLTKQQ